MEKPKRKNGLGVISNEQVYRKLFFKHQRKEFIMEVSECAEMFGISYKAATTHLSKLRCSGLIDTVRRVENGKLRMFVRLLETPKLLEVEQEYLAKKKAKELNKV